jgi:hypothetical protein
MNANANAEDLIIVQIQEVYKATIQKLKDFVTKYKESTDKKQRLLRII